MIYMRNITITTAKSATYLENVGLYFFSKSDLSKELGVDKILSRVGDQAAKARGPRTPDDQRRKAFEDAQSEIEKCFTALVAKTVAGEPTPAFARARVRLDRTGRCEIEISPGDLYINRLVKSAHRSGVGSALWQDPETIKKFDLGERFIARHVYNVVRGLSHKHYHHHEHADLLATTYPWSASDDQTWRRETLYGLARMAIEIRRRGTAKAFKQCAGVVAYAEAFQLHLGTWSLASDGSITSAKTVPPYDFGALRNSVDASLKVRELEDAERRQTIIYLTTIFLAALTLVVGGMRALETPPNGLFADFLTITTNRPFETIGLAILLGWLCDLAFLRAALPLPATRRYFYGLKRFVAAAMGSLIARKVSPLVSYMLALLFLALLFAGAAGLSLYSIGLLSRQLGALALGS